LKQSFFCWLHLFRNTGCSFCIKIFELVTVGSAESLLALNLGLLLCLFFYPQGFGLCSCGYTWVFVYCITCQTCGCVN
jgi:hypothetical protein